MTQSRIPAHCRAYWTMWLRVGRHWQLVCADDEANVERAAAFQTRESLTLPPGERPLMKGERCHRERRPT